MRRSFAVVFMILLTGGLVHCGGTPPDGPDTRPGRDGGSDGTEDRDGGVVCEPKTCADTEQCGTYDDGCGGTLRCDEACACTPNDFEVTCPPRPCEVVAGCSEGVCQYQPVTCGDAGDEQACAPVACEGDGCGNVATEPGETDKLYACGGQVCAGVNQYCDPSAVIQGGEIVYQNKCVAPPKVGCGTCDLGEAMCNLDTDRFDCDALSVPVLEGGGTVECDSTVAGSTFVFVDAQYTAGGADGSRERPYTSYGAALGAAQARNARGIAIAGSPTFTEPLVVHNGISVYGGFDTGFTPNRAQRPRWVVPASAVNGNALIGATARNVTSGTVLYHLDIETADVAGHVDGHGISNIGLWTENATALRLEEVTVKAGAASPGPDGEDGTAGAPGGDANGAEPGAAGFACASSCTVSGAPAVNGNKCGAGGRIDTSVYFPQSSQRGNSNGLTGSSLREGGAAGRTAHPHGCNYASEGEEQTAGSSGLTGVGGEDGLDGGGGERAALSAAGVSTPTRMDGADGKRGSWGSGGGAGGSFYQNDGCMNDANWGGSGGGAGGPGCGGTAAQGGGAGGLSAAVVVVGSSQNLVLRTSSLIAGKGGDGGEGGQGGDGGPGGEGAAGAEAEPPGNEDNRGRKGGRGGDGGSGGRGGHGGGGAAGSSFGIWCETTSMNVSRDGSTTITAGAVGAPGQSSGEAGAAGESTAVANCSTP